jgi:hypothetical protein
VLEGVKREKGKRKNEVSRKILKNDNKNSDTRRIGDNKGKGTIGGGIQGEVIGEIVKQGGGE